MSAKIILNRKREWINNRNRGVKVFIDQIEKGKIANGDSEEYMVDPGEHTMQCKVYWCSSPALNIDIKEGETKYLQLKSAMKYYGIGYALFLIGLLAGIFMTLTHIPKPSFFTWMQLTLLLPLVLYLLFYLTLGRKKYMVLEEDANSVFA